MTAALIALAVVTVIDVLTTIAALRKGLVEANPIMRKLMDELGGAWWLAKVAMTVGLAWLFYAQDFAAGVWIVAAILAVVVANNFRHLARR